ncbi:SDR family oxidoreductase [Parahaliea maris]|uniref:SDR family oxidoreductase n=1 Tax=Parahaliea maris TaxID=2716870 RepID=A0A5C9A5H0_9GAMM|nr:SDR family oxidoreductase [Parahaliea maris]TXS96143.1 SDR family oxidoreductase [Parahaliea maris]
MSWQQSISLVGKVALVTGGGAGIGRAIVSAYSELGADIVIAEIDPEKCNELQASFPNALVQQCDVRDAVEVDALAQAVQHRFGGLNVLVNNVGHHLGVFKELSEFTEDDWDSQHAINLRHMFLVSRAMIPLMKASGNGSIINFSSVEGFRGCPYNVGYTTFKHAVRGFTESLSMELSNYGIRVNNIAPETTDTEQVPLDQVYKPEYREGVGKTIPLGRMGRPEDHAGAAVYLASELSSWVTGTSMLVDGGTLPQGPFHRVPSGRWSNAPMVTDNISYEV